MRELTESERQRLEARGCSATDWARLRVSDDFDASRFRNVTFLGENQIGSLSGSVHFCDVEMPCAIENAVLNDCVIDDNVLVRNVSLLSGYHVKSGASVVDCGSICAKKSATFGIGTRVSVVNEGGGREVVLHPELSSNVAHLMAFRRSNLQLINTLEKIADSDSHKYEAEIGCHSQIAHVKCMDDVFVGASAVICGASALANGFVASCKQQPTRVGSDVVAHDFIFSEGSSVDSASVLHGCFIGQCTQVGNGYSAENLVAFANGQFFNGEAASVLAGPFTVTHHKTTLLIAGAYSFFNAGSATNASNHHYKLGPNHQAIYERGVKTGSGSYVLEPAHIGAFTMVTGSHKSHPNTSNFPFSYLIEKNGESHLMPTQNLKTIGNFRDEEKWAKRDKRHADFKRDRLTADVYNPLTISKMLSAAERLRTLSQGKAENILCDGFRLRRGFLERAANAYEQVADAYIVNAFLKSWSEKSFPEKLENDIVWIDFGGLVADRSDVERFEKQIVNGEYSSMSELNKAVECIEESAKRKMNQWLLMQAEKRHALTPNSVDSEVCAAAQKVVKAFTDIQNTILADAAKEFGGKMLVGYGIDYDAAAAKADFESVRGTAETNDVVGRVRAFYESRMSLARDIIAKFNP